jgi:hypothetical protein
VDGSISEVSGETSRANQGTTTRTDGTGGFLKSLQSSEAPSRRLEDGETVAGQAVALGLDGGSAAGLG